MEKNPKIAIDALLESGDIEVAKQMIKPITIARYALLELVDSPIIQSDKKLTYLDMIPTIYIMTQDVSELKKYNSSNVEQLRQNAAEWCEEHISVKQVPIITAFLLKKVIELVKAAPSPAGDQKKA